MCLFWCSRISSSRASHVPHFARIRFLSVDENVEMVDINKIETQVATAGMANTIEVTTSVGE